jgi:regulator of replication initiation timing
VTTELERIKVLEGKIGHVIEYVNKLAGENEKLRQQLKELRVEKKDMEELGRRAGKLDEELKRYDNERELLRSKIEALIGQIDKLGI